jgi:5,10-methylene-tetrahydrofolate dehydrogenase/methenyl tetrahydrofolate cyclohydrolase
MLALHKNATVTICHSKTVDIPGIVKQADIIIAAVGKAEMVNCSFITPSRLKKIGSNLVLSLLMLESTPFLMPLKRLATD